MIQLTTAHVEKIIQNKKILLTDFIDFTSNFSYDLKIENNFSLLGKLELRYTPRNGFSIVYCGERIRGINHHMKKHRPDCKTIRGWHEHRWDEFNRDKFVVQVKELPNRRNLSPKQIFDICCKKWNIEYKGNKYADELFK